MGIQIEFYIDGKYLKTWPNWTGVIPNKDDILILHFGDNNEEVLYYRVIGRAIDGTKSDRIGIYLEWLDKGMKDGKD